MAINKVVYGNSTLIDLSVDTVAANKIASGYTAHDASGTRVIGTMDTIGANGLTWSQLTNRPWGIVSGVPTVQSKTITPTTSQQVIGPDNGYDYLSSVTVSAIDVQSKTVTPSASQQIITPDSDYDFLSQVTVNASVPMVKTKTLTFSSAVSASTLIWPASELADWPLSNLAGFERLLINCTKTDTSHTTYQTTCCNCYYPSAMATASLISTGTTLYHTSKATSVNLAHNTVALTTATAGYFQVTSSGIYYVAGTYFKLSGTYLFTVAAKLA